MTPAKPTPEVRERIEHLAKNAAANGTRLGDACPYPFDTVEGKHFIAVYMLALPKEKQG